MKISIFKRVSAVFAASFLFCLTTFSGSAYSGEVAIDGRPIQIFPQVPSLYHPLFFTVLDGKCELVNINLVSLEPESKLVRISMNLGEVEFTPCLPESFVRSTQIAGIEAPGVYQLDFYREHSTIPENELFNAEAFFGSMEVIIENTLPVYRSETPTEGSLQSGIGLVRGWACDADTVEIQFDDLPRQNVGYGTSRLDTIELCGDDNNGYGFVVAWGNLGLGFHRMRTFMDGVPVADVQFEVVGLPDPFIEGLTAEYTLGVFPEAGQSVTIQWSQADQNFIITEQLAE